jgi:hypothetical protein
MEESFMRIDGKSLIIGAVLGVGAFVWAAFPQTLRLASALVRIPYTVDSVFVRHATDGSSTVDIYSTSYNHNGNEIRLSSSVPGHPFASAIRSTLDVAQFVLLHQTALFHVDAEEAERAAAAVRVNNGCEDGPVVGREMILNYSTVAVQFTSTTDRITLWMSPDLGCFPLKMTYDERRPGGTFRQIIDRHALKVTSHL